MLNEAIWPFPTREMTVDDGAVHTTDTGGDLPAVLLVHVGLSSLVWRDAIALLRDRYRCITLDAPGTGASPRSADITLDGAARAVRALIDRAGLDELTLVVHDLGGPVGLAAVADRPEQVRGIVAVNSFGWRPSGAVFRSMLAVMGSAVVRELDAITGALPRASATRFGAGRRWDRATRRAFREGIDARAFHRYMHSARGSDELYAKIEAALESSLADRPLVTVFGERNDPLGLQAKWRARFPEATQLVVPKGYHFPMCDAPELVAEAVEAAERLARS